jgi:hypothetical protein
MTAPGITYPYMGRGNGLPFCVRKGSVGDLPRLFDMEGGVDAGVWDMVPFPGANAAEQWDNFRWWFWRFKGIELASFRIEYYITSPGFPDDGPYEITPGYLVNYPNVHLPQSDIEMDNGLYGADFQRACLFEAEELFYTAKSAFPLYILHLRDLDGPDYTVDTLLYFSVCAFYDDVEPYPVLLYRMGNEDGGPLTVGTPANLIGPQSQGAPAEATIRLGPNVGDTAVLEFVGSIVDGLSYEVSAAEFNFQYWT